jgi:hypothetical protein
MTPATSLFDLLPALYRLKDAQLAAIQPLLTPAEKAQLQALQALTPPLSPDEQDQLNQLTAKASRGPLASLLALVDEQLAVLAQDLNQLYDNQFIETCAPWVIPYTGDLIGYQEVNGIAPAVASPRAEVAHTISFRRRKGTVLVMEQLARDVTGWGAHAVEFFQVLADTQYANHIRPFNCYSPDLRKWQPGLYMDTGFDQTAHKVDVRRIAGRRGRYNIQNIGIFLWSLNSYSLTQAPATAVVGAPRCFRFSPLGRDIPLFNNPVSQGPDITAPAQPLNVPAPLPRRVLCQDLQSGAGAVYYGEGNSLALYLDGKLLNPYQVQVCNLSGPDGSWANLPPSGSPYLAAIDPQLGRIAVSAAAGARPKLHASFHYGFNADMGGGEYAREQGFVVQNEAFVLPYPDTAMPARYNSLEGALVFAVQELSENGQVAVEVAGSRVYALAAGLTVNLPAGATIELRGAEGAWPTLELKGEIAVTGAASSTFVMNGLLITSRVPPGPPRVALVHAPATSPSGSPNALGTLAINHCTLIPGWALDPRGDPEFPAAPGLEAAAPGLRVAIQRSILGGMRAQELVTASLTDSVVDARSRTNVAYSAADGVSAGGPLTLQGCTVIGKVHSMLLTLVTDSIVWAGLATGDIWAAPLIADRKQAGCVRYSFLPPGSVTPRQFACVEQGPGVSQPLFFSLRYGDPAYAKLLASTDDTIRRGASDGGEMGAFHFVLAPLRETDLRLRMQEYLPVGLEFGIIYQN